MSFRELNETIESAWSIWNNCEIVGKAVLQMLSELDTDRSKILSATIDRSKQFCMKWAVCCIVFKGYKIQQCLSIAFHTSRNFGQSQSESRETRDGNVKILIWFDLRHSTNDKFRGFLWDKIRVLWNTWQCKVA